MRLARLRRVVRKSPPWASLPSTFQTPAPANRREDGGFSLFNVQSESRTWSRETLTVAKDTITLLNLLDNLFYF